MQNSNTLHLLSEIITFKKLEPANVWQFYLEINWKASLIIKVVAGSFSYDRFVITAVNSTLLSLITLIFTNVGKSRDSDLFDLMHFINSRLSLKGLRWFLFSDSSVHEFFVSLVVNSGKYDVEVKCCHPVNLQQEDKLSVCRSVDN